MLIQFGQPVWLAAGLLCCLAAALFIRVNIKRRKKALRSFASVHLLTELTRNVSLSRRRIKNILFVLGLACLFVALAHPQYGNRWVEVKRKGIDILIGIDVSKSMLVQDISPNRLSRAKLAVRDFVAKLEGDRVGLLPFAGTSFLMCPLTTDYDAFNASLDALDTTTIPKGGTDIGAAIREADTTLANEANHKIFVLVTDGEDLNDDALKAAEEAKKNKMTIYTIGVGTPEGELIPIPGKQSQTFIQDKEGNFVTSKLDEKALTEIAAKTGGLYVPLGTMGQGFDTIYQKKLSLVPKEEHGQRKRKVPIERFPWALGLAILLLGSDFLLTGRKSSWLLRLPFVKTAKRRKKQQAAVLGLLLLTVTLSWTANGQASIGEDLYKAGNYAEAMEYYQKELEKNISSPVLHYNLGTSAYQNGNYETAIKEFNNALKTEDLTLQAKSYYNKGSSLFAAGNESIKTDPEQTIKLWEESKQAFKGSLYLKPDDKNTSNNLNILEKKLDELKKLQKKKEKELTDEKGNYKRDKNGKEKALDKQNKDKSQQNQQGKEDKSDQGQQQDKENKNKQDKSQNGADKDKKEKDKEADSAGNKQDKKKTDDKKQQAAAADQASQQSDKKKSGQENGKMSKQDMQRRLQGKMTKEEAKNLLNSLKGEQRELNFIPQGTGAMEDNTRDW